VGMAGVAWRCRTWSRAPLAAFLFFIGTLTPALGFVNVYPFRFTFVADHFQYLASLGVIALFAAALSTMARGVTSVFRIAGSAALALILGTLTWHHSQQYVDAETLYRATIREDPTVWLAQNNLASLLLRRSHRDTEEAIEHLRSALRVKPDYPEAHFNLGLAF